MKNICINFANNIYLDSQTKCSYSAKNIAYFDEVIEFSPRSLPDIFFSKYKLHLKNKRGFGFWIWKPYIIYNCLLNLNEGDSLFYIDSGAYFTSPIDEFINYCYKNKIYIGSFELDRYEFQWTKGDLFYNMNLLNEKYINSFQRNAAFIFLIKNQLSLQFAKEYLSICENIENIDDVSCRYLPNFRSFLEHRHDQSVFSLLSKKYDLIPLADPSQFRKISINSYLPFIYHHRSNDINILIKVYLKIMNKFYRFYNFIRSYVSCCNIS